MATDRGHLVSPPSERYGFVMTVWISKTVLRKYRRPTSAAVVALVVEVVVEVSYHVTNRLLASLRIQRVLDRLRRFHEVVDVDARTVAEHSPEHARHAKQQRLCEQYDRYPLVVADVALNDTWLTRYRFLVR